jgi:hypothetical protein
MVLQKVPQFNFENGYIPEESFQLLHERPNIENSNQANLNDFVTNRQHCLLIGNNKLNELNNRTKRRGRQIVCSTQRVCLLKLTKEVSGSNVGSPDARKSFVVQICAMPSRGCVFDSDHKHRHTTFLITLSWSIHVQVLFLFSPLQAIFFFCFHPSIFRSISFLFSQCICL